MATSETSDEIDLGALRASMGLTIREMAALAGVSAPTFLRWERGDRHIPDEAKQLFEEFAASRSESITEIVLRAVADGGSTLLELRTRLEKPRLQRELDRLIADGTLCLAPVPRTDARGRAYVRPGVFHESSGRRRALDRSAPLASGAVLAAARRRQGIAAEELADRVGVAPSTYRYWEASSPPRARVPQLAAALDECPSGNQIRRLRTAAKWSLAEFGRRTGVHLSVVHNWETGYRPVPPGRKAALLAAMSDAEQAARERPEQAVRRIVSVIERHPGIMRSELRHRLRIRVDGKQRLDPFMDRALRMATRTGRVAEIADHRFDSSGRPRTARRLYPKDDAPRVPEQMSGDELGRLRERLGWTQRSMGDALGISATSISVWERRHECNIPSYWAGRVRQWASEQPTEDSDANQARGRVLEAIRNNPGIGRWQLSNELDLRKVTKRALAMLLREGEVVRAPARDDIGRTYVGLYLQADCPEPERPFDGSELRRQRIAAGWSASDLGDSVGVKGNTVTRWETGARACSPEKLETLLEVLSERCPEGAQPMPS
ncbi:MAG TPA: DUF1870 family protein [Acidimicrobiales bacterium]|jgi:transcriptional regulator with XRE-family HTH domain|nr:DUF1870 family protein [Acidimicrobiales bacterium]